MKDQEKLYESQRVEILSSPCYLGLNDVMFDPSFYGRVMAVSHSAGCVYMQVAGWQVMLMVGVTVKEESRRQCRGEEVARVAQARGYILPQSNLSSLHFTRPHPRPVPRETTRLRLVMWKSFYAKSTVVSHRSLFHAFYTTSSHHDSRYLY